MRNGKLCVGIIGLQGYGGTYFASLSTLPWAEITAICDKNEEVLQRNAKQHDIRFCFTDYTKMLQNKEIDVVFIATPHFLHYKMTMDALRAGKHVFCEKPLAMNHGEAEEMNAQAEAKGLLLSCHYNRRQSALVKLLKEVADRQTFGGIYAVHVKWMARYTPFMFSEDSAWRREKAKAGGGILIGRGSHMIDAVLYIMDYPGIKSVSANISSRLTGLEVDDYCMLMLRLKNGATITIECSYENNIPQYQEKIEYQIFGTKAGAYCAEENGKESVQIGYCRFPENQWVDISDQYRAEDYAEREPESIIADFMKALRGGTKPLIDGRSAAYVTSIIDAAYASAEEGREIILEECHVSEGI